MSGDVNNVNVQKAAERFGENMLKYPIEEQIAVGAISKNLLNGCSWEFVRSNPDIKRNLDAFKRSKCCSAQEVTYDEKRGITGYLIYMRMDRLLGILNKEAAGLVNQKDIEIAQKHRQEAVIALDKLLLKGYKGRIGIYCTNDSQTITVDGKPYPAYALSLKEMLSVCAKRGYGVYIKGAVRNPSDVLAREDGILKACIVAPSSNALFINIAPMR